MKRIFAILLVLVLSLGLLAGCGGGDSEMKIAIVTSPSGVDDGSFNEDNYNGILSFIESNSGAEVVAINEPTGAADASVQAVQDIVADYDVIVACGFQFAGIGAFAGDNPDTKFILVDTFPTDPTSDTPFDPIEVDNVYAMQFLENESGFFAGVSAAMETKTNKVAVVNGVAFPSNVNYQWGFESGVNYANAHLGTDVEIVELPSYAGTDVTGLDVGGNYVGDFNDPTTGKVVGQALIDEGVDIIFTAAGNSGNGVLTAVKENSDVSFIGCDVDQYDQGAVDDRNVIITSALKVMSINVERQLTAIQDGSFAGGNYYLGADTDSTGYVKEDGRHQLMDETLMSLEDLYPLIQDGTIVPASNFGGTTPENFVGL